MFESWLIFKSSKKEFEFKLILGFFNESLVKKVPLLSLIIFSTSISRINSLIVFIACSLPPNKLPTTKDRLSYKYFSSNFFDLYKSGYEVFKNYPLFGVGNKNYRLETKDRNKNKKYKNNSHPHQIYLELLSEHGIIGATILLVIFFTLIFKNIKIIILSKNSVQLGAFSYLVSVFLPIIPSGSFFNDFNISLFFINLSILYASNPKTNIFEKKI